MKDWGSNNYETFALIPHLPVDMDKKLDAFINKNLDDGTKVDQSKAGTTHRYTF